MANLRTELYYDHHNRAVTRLGHNQMSANVHTWNTFVEITLYDNGSGRVVITQNGKVLQKFDIPEERGE